MLPAKKIITQPGYATLQNGRQQFLPYMIRFFVGRVCYPPKKSLRNPGMLPSKTAGKMPALHDTILRRAGMLTAENGISYNGYAARL